MAQTSYPYVNQAVTDAQYADLFEEFQDDGVEESYGSNALQLYATSAGLTSRVRTGSYIIRGYRFNSSAEEVLTHDAAHATLPRRDRVVLELNVALTNVLDRVKLKIVKGTPSASAPVPSLAQNKPGIYQKSLGSVLIAANSFVIAPADVADEREFVGMRLRAWNTKTRPTAPRRGQMGFNDDIKGYEYWNGTRYTPYDVPRVNSVSARDDIFPVGVVQQGDMVYRLDRGWTERYYALKDATTNPGGAWIAGWYPVDGKLPYFSASASGVSVTNANEVEVIGGTWNYDDEFGFMIPDTKRFKPNIPGYYIVTGRAQFQNNTNGMRMFGIVKNIQRPAGQDGPQGPAMPFPFDAKQMVPAYALGNGNISVAAEMWFNGTTDYISMQVWQDSGGGMSGSAGGQPYFQMAAQYSRP